MTCPHCGIAFHTNEGTWDDERVTFAYSTEEDLVCSGTMCPACDGVVIVLFRTRTDSYDRTTDWTIIYPSESRPPTVSDAVPDNLKADYVEAYMVLPISPKASAALSRRFLQALLNEQGFTKANLYEQIQDTIAERQSDRVLPSHLRTVIYAIRRFGNFSAHPITDLTTLQVINVDPEEAAWCLILQSQIHSDSTLGLPISLFSSITDTRTEAKFDSLQVPPALKSVICDYSTNDNRGIIRPLLCQTRSRRRETCGTRPKASAKQEVKFVKAGCTVDQSDGTSQLNQS